MSVSRDDVVHNIDQLVRASEDLEKRLSEGGYSQAHDWMFAIREMLYDLRRLNIRLADLFNTTNTINQGPPLLHDIVKTVLYEIVPHVQGHLDELDQSLTTLLANSEDPAKDD